MRNCSSEISISGRMLFCSDDAAGGGGVIVAVPLSQLQDRSCHLQVLVQLLQSPTNQHIHIDQNDENKTTIYKNIKLFS